MQTMLNRAFQQRLAALGFYGGRIDGDLGARTQAALVAFKAACGMRARLAFTAVTLTRLFAADAPRKEAPGTTPETAAGAGAMPPWAAELHARLGWREHRHAARLLRWFRAHGKVLGDPRRFPWCGEGMENAVLAALPGETVPTNPFWARAWAAFGVPCAYVPGAVGVIAWKKGGGHVGVVADVARDRAGRIARVKLLGCNQGDAIAYRWFAFESAAGGFVAARWPKTFPKTDYAPFGPRTRADGGGRAATR